MHGEAHEAAHVPGGVAALRHAVRPVPPQQLQAGAAQRRGALPPALAQAAQGAALHRGPVRGGVAVAGVVVGVAVQSHRAVLLLLRVNLTQSQHNNR